MESFPLARLAHSFDSANQLAVPADHSIKSSFHFVLASLFFWFFSFFSLRLLLSPHPVLSKCPGQRIALAVIFSKCFLRFIIKIWLAAIAALFEFMCRQMLPDCDSDCDYPGCPATASAFSSGNLSYFQRRSLTNVARVNNLLGKLKRCNLITLIDTYLKRPAKYTYIILSKIEQQLCSIL